MTVKEILLSNYIQRIEREIIDAYNGVGIRYRNKIVLILTVFWRCGKT